MSFQIMSLELILPTLPEYAMILEVDWSGNIVHSWHSNSADLRFFSDAKIIVSILENCLFGVHSRFFPHFRTATCILDPPLTTLLAALRFKVPVKFTCFSFSFQIVGWVSF